ncbi:MAG: hypothetical protein IPL61_36960 [Myxococcales bacterium]|nr:hypothetical protein [Myxococcales bacterium]
MKLVAVVAVLACACGGSAKQTAAPPANAPIETAEPAPPPEETPVAPAELTDAEFETMMTQALAMFGAMGSAADAAGGDCGKLADGIDRVMNDNQPFIQSMKKYKGDEAMDKRAEAWMKDHMDEVMEPMMKVGAAGQNCADDPKFQATMQQFEDLE